MFNSRAHVFVLTARDFTSRYLAYVLTNGTTRSVSTASVSLIWSSLYAFVQLVRREGLMTWSKPNREPRLWRAWQPCHLRLRHPPTYLVGWTLQKILQMCVSYWRWRQLTLGLTFSALVSNSQNWYLSMFLALSCSFILVSASVPADIL